MENYTIEKVNIDMHNEDVYTIRKNGRYKVYNYNHEFINESKVIKTSSCILHKDVYKRQDYRSVTYTLRELEFKVSKIIKEDDGYDTGVTTLIIYIPYENLMYIMSHIDEKKEIISSYYIDKVLSKQVSAQPYTMNEYVLFVDEDYVACLLYTSQKRHFVCWCYKVLNTRI